MQNVLPIRLSRRTKDPTTIQERNEAMIDNKTPVLVSRYTYTAWMQHDPNSSYFAWQRANMPENLNGLLKRVWDSGRIDKEKEFIKIITIDEEYYGWLTANDLTGTPEALNEYKRRMPDKEATRLLKKNFMDVSDDILGFLFRLRSKKAKKDISIVKSLETKKLKEIEAAAGSILGANQVVASGMYFSADEVRLLEPMIREAMYESLDSRLSGEEDDYTYEDRHIPLGFSGKTDGWESFYLPFVYRMTHDTALFEYESDPELMMSLNLSRDEANGAFGGWMKSDEAEFEPPSVCCSLTDMKEFALNVAEMGEFPGSLDITDIF